MKYKILMILLLCIVAAGGFTLGHLPVWQQEIEETEGTSEEKAVPVYDDVEYSNPFSGVVESQKKWSVNKESGSTVKEVFVSVGDEVKTGDPLFEYDIEKKAFEKQQAELDLQRLHIDMDNIGKRKEELEKAKAKAKASEQEDYELQLQENDLQNKQKELEIKSKELEIQKLEEATKNSIVESEIDGVVSKINQADESGLSYSSNQDNSFITVMRTGDLRIKGTINETQIGQLSIGVPVQIHSRVDQDKVWTGTISEINTSSAAETEGDQFYSNGSESGSSNYNFYVAIDDSEGLMIGQHVYILIEGMEEEIPEEIPAAAGENTTDVAGENTTLVDVGGSNDTSVSES